MDAKPLQEARTVRWFLGEHGLERRFDSIPTVVRSLSHRMRYRDAFCVLSMIFSVIAGPCMSERLTTHRNSRSNASRSGGGPKVRSVFPTADTYLSWLTLVGATAQPAVHGNTASNTSCATSTVCTSRSHTIHQERPSGTQSSTDCSEISKNWAGRRSTATKPS